MKYIAIQMCTVYRIVPNKKKLMTNTGNQYICSSSLPFVSKQKYVMSLISNNLYFNNRVLLPSLLIL
ncbi:hypothetical protein KUTeg_022788 [Tegillarca granosa]|uniref:Uncharacterized protein n=1 Tax=Tegillarca granosa TaxID=220873 RepID=A0ABQ9DZU7_TEGGR|nr:hypothetical protein KUTeg_022788 [Tegillarca granosa]